jgi:dipeptidyl aminopeptidase/acylaminoacyl peptidase
MQYYSSGSILKFSTPLLLFIISFESCKESCYTLDMTPACPYSQPVWYPDGSMLGFNHQSVKSVSVSGPCSPFYYVNFYDDSDGFWLVNKDGTNMHRVTRFEITAPAWSPDGKWIAFVKGDQICKMGFDGTNFDTSHIITLTNNTDNFYTCWNTNSDTIYYASYQGHPGLGYQIYKMAADGTGQTLIGNKGPDSLASVSPFCTTDNKIIHVRGDTLSQYIFSMNSNGDSVRQLTKYEGTYEFIDYPTYYNNNLYYQNEGIWRVNMDGSGLVQLCTSSTRGFSISKDGIIVYPDFGSLETSVVDKTHGVIWTMNTDGSNQKPLTYNNY